MNAIITAIETAKTHIEKFTSSPNGKDVRRKELKKLSKEDLIDLVISQEKFSGIKIEDIAKPILEDPKCAWLDYNTIAELIKTAVPTAKTTSKSLASYASKYPKLKGWEVQTRKTAAERQQVMLNLINQ